MSKYVDLFIKLYEQGYSFSKAKEIVNGLMEDDRRWKQTG